MDWTLYIHADPRILNGKPVIKGTRLSVEFLPGLFAAGWSEQQVLENYPTLDVAEYSPTIATPEALRTVFSFAAE